MNRFNSIWVAVFAAWLLFSPLDSDAVDLESRYATITYFDDDDLRDFNRHLYLGRLKSRIKGSTDTIEEEVVSKINFIVEKVMSTLDMFPSGLRFSIEILSKDRDVHQAFYKIYNVNVEYIAFYSPSRNRVFYSADDTNLRVVSHEIGHVVAENYFTISPPRKSMKSWHNLQNSMLQIDFLHHFLCPFVARI